MKSSSIRKISLWFSITIAAISCLITANSVFPRSVQCDEAKCLYVNAVWIDCEPEPYLPCFCNGVYEGLTFHCIPNYIVYPDPDGPLCNEILCHKFPNQSF